MIQHRQHSTLEKKRWTVGDVVIVTGLSFLVMFLSMMVYKMVTNRRNDEYRR